MSQPRTSSGVFKARGRRSRREAVSTPESVGRVPRVARLMALAIRLDGLIKNGAVPSQAELAVLGHVTRARVTQIMNLLHLAPDIQERILHLPQVTSGRDPITERDLRPIAGMVRWCDQRNAVDRLQGQYITQY